MAVDLAKMEDGDIAIFRNGEIRQAEKVEDRTGKMVSNKMRSHIITFNGLVTGYFFSGHAYSPNQQCNIDIVEVIKNPQKRPLADIIKGALA